MEKNSNKRIYEEPVLEVIALTECDIITASPDTWTQTEYSSKGVQEEIIG